MGSDGGEGGAYFTRRDDGLFMPTDHVGGAWNVAEQHVAPAIGLLAHAIEADHAARRADRLQIARLSYDIWGTIPMEAVAIDVAVLRPGRTIELVEARLSHAGRPAIVLRAWLSQAYESAATVAMRFPSLPAPDTMPSWQPSSLWAGGFIASVDVRRSRQEPGRAQCWVRSPLALIAGKPVSATARAMGLADIANGLTPLFSPEETAFPNLDLTAHVFRAPELLDGWFGLDISVACGPTGLGLTHSILHDARGPFGAMSQCLTVRHRS